MMEVDSKILDAYGNPMKRALLTQEIAGPTLSGVRSIISDHPASGLTPPRLASILRESEYSNHRRYFELAEQMEEQDMHYASVLGTRKRAVAQMPMRVEPADDSAQAQEDAAFVEEWLDRDTLDTEIEDILDAIGKGASFTEIIWDQGDYWLPGQLEHRNPVFFEFDRTDGKTPMLIDEGGQLIALQPAKFICHVHKFKSGLPIRGGLARAVAWGWMFKNYAIKDWVSFLEAYGQPVRVGRHDTGASEGDIRKLMQAVSQIGTDAAAVYPRTMDIEFIDAKAGTAPNELWRSLSEYIDDQVSKVVLGQTSSADAKASGIGSGQSDLHGDVRDDIARSDAKLLAATLNRDLVRPMIGLNFGARKKYPRIKIEKPDAIDVQAMVLSAEKLTALGVAIDADEMRDKAGLPAPKSKDAKILTSPEVRSALIAQNQVCQNGTQERLESDLASATNNLTAPHLLDPLKSATGYNHGVDLMLANTVARDKDAIDNLTDEVIDAWDALFPAMMDAIADDISTASNAADVQNILARQLTLMDSDRFAALLSDAGFSTFIAGELDAKNDEVR